MVVGNKMHKAFPLPGESSHWQYKFPLPVKVVPTAKRLEMPLSGVCTAIEEMMKKLPDPLQEFKMKEGCGMVKIRDGARIDSENVHFDALEKQYNTTCVKKKHKEIWIEVEVQVPNLLSWTPENVIKDIHVVEQATNAS
nr:hypothetical protein [Tanacetum cinerariifolium]